MSAAEYEKKFSKLARFVPNTWIWSRKRQRDFSRDLTMDSRVAVFELQKYATVIQKAMMVEGESEMTNKDIDSKKRKF